MKDMDVYILENQVDRTKGIDALMGWIGGKSQLRAELAARMPEQDVPVTKRKLKYYVEVFGGMAWLLLYRPRWFEYEIYNDYNGDIVNLMTIIKEHPIEFWRNLKMIPNSEKYYNHMISNEGLTDVNRAVATYIKYAWSFSSSGENYSARAVSKLGVWRKIKLLADRLDRVSIMNKSYSQIIVRYNKPHVFLYLDPPYYGKEEFYEMVFSRENHEELSVLLGGFKGSFMLSYNDCKEVRELYKDFKIEQINCSYFAMGKKNGTVGSELIITNY